MVAVVICVSAFVYTCINMWMSERGKKTVVSVKNKNKLVSVMNL